MGYGLDYQGSVPSGGKRFFSIAQCPDQLWGPPSLPSNGYQGQKQDFKIWFASEVYSKWEISLLLTELIYTYALSLMTVFSTVNNSMQNQSF
jgi:hypothetical protein